MTRGSQTITTMVKPGITALGYRTALKDYNEDAVVEELAANCYDSDASTALILLDSKKNELHFIDDGIGFSKKAMLQCGMLGGGDKQDIEYSKSKRPYLGAYGMGLKATGNIAKTLTIDTISDEGKFDIVVDWTHLEEELKETGGGYELHQSKKPGGLSTGTHITLGLSKPTSDRVLANYASALANLPDGKGTFRCYVGKFQEPKIHRQFGRQDIPYQNLKSISRSLLQQKCLQAGNPSTNLDLEDCKVIEGETSVGKDKHSLVVPYKIFFTGIQDGNVSPMKRGLRGIYVRIHGRLLKRSFDEQKYVQPISKWINFSSGLRVELTLDWLRGEISLARDSLKFSSEIVEEKFTEALTKVINGFIRPQMKKLEKKTKKRLAKEHTQRLELANKRSRWGKDVCVPGIHTGYRFMPETDAELALLIANEAVMKKIAGKDAKYKLLDYNDKAAFDCVLYDTKRRKMVCTELEPTLVDFCKHKTIPDQLELIITWLLGKWRMGAKHKGIKYCFGLVSEPEDRPGFYKLNVYRRKNSKTPHRHFSVIAIDRVLNI